MGKITQNGALGLKRSSTFYLIAVTYHTWVLDGPIRFFGYERTKLELEMWYLSSTCNFKVSQLFRLVPSQIIFRTQGPAGAFLLLAPFESVLQVLEGEMKGGEKLSVRSERRRKSSELL